MSDRLRRTNLQRSSRKESARQLAAQHPSEPSRDRDNNTEYNSLDTNTRSYQENMLGQVCNLKKLPPDVRESIKLRAQSDSSIGPQKQMDTSAYATTPPFGWHKRSGWDSVVQSFLARHHDGHGDIYGCAMSSWPDQTHYSRHQAARLRPPVTRRHSSEAPKSYSGTGSSSVRAGGGS